MNPPSRPLPVRLGRLLAASITGLFLACGGNPDKYLESPATNAAAGASAAGGGSAGHDAPSGRDTSVFGADARGRGGSAGTSLDTAGTSVVPAGAANGGTSGEIPSGRSGTGTQGGQAGDPVGSLDAHAAEVPDGSDLDKPAAPGADSGGLQDVGGGAGITAPAAASGGSGGLNGGGVAGGGSPGAGTPNGRESGAAASGYSGGGAQSGWAGSTSDVGSAGVAGLQDHGGQGGISTPAASGTSGSSGSSGVESVGGRAGGGAAAGCTEPPTCGSCCSTCILRERPDVLDLYASIEGWDISCANQDTIVNDWAGIDPFASFNLRRGACAADCPLWVENCGSYCTQCILGVREDVVLGYREGGSLILCSNLDAITADWCGVDPGGCGEIKAEAPCIDVCQ